MKRYLELVKRILIRMEARDQLEPHFSVPRYNEKTVGYHVVLMEQAGLIEAIVHKYLDGTVDGIPIRLTWQGHEWLDLARNNTVWKKAKKRLGDKALTIGFDMMKILLAEITKQMLLPK